MYYSNILLSFNKFTLRKSLWITMSVKCPKRATISPPGIKTLSISDITSVCPQTCMMDPSIGNIFRYKKVYKQLFGTIKICFL